MVACYIDSNDLLQILIQGQKDHSNFLAVASAILFLKFQTFRGIRNLLAGLLKQPHQIQFVHHVAEEFSQNFFGITLACHF